MENFTALGNGLSSPIDTRSILYLKVDCLSNLLLGAVSNCELLGADFSGINIPPGDIRRVRGEYTEERLQTRGNPLLFSKSPPNSGVPRTWNRAIQPGRITQFPQFQLRKPFPAPNLNL
jgi:hypothetical protein